MNRSAGKPAIDVFRRRRTVKFRIVIRKPFRDSRGLNFDSFRSENDIITPVYHL